MQSMPISTEREWQVIFNEGNHWRVGVYRPKYRSRGEIRELEEHTCPEAFVLVSGRVTMLYRQSDGSLSEKELSPRELVVLTEPHAGFSPEGDGVALVVENAAFETTYTDHATGDITRKVTVSP